MKETTLKELVTNYMNAIIYWYRFEKQFDLSVSEKYAEMIGRYETELRKNGVNNDQIDKLLYYAKYFLELKQFSMSDNSLYYVKQMVFPER